MDVNIGQIANPVIFVKPSQKLIDFIKDIKITDNIPPGIQSFIYKNKIKQTSNAIKRPKLKYLMTDGDRDFVNSVVDVSNHEIQRSVDFKQKSTSNSKSLSLQDLHWLYKCIKEGNSNNLKKIYLHELLEDSEIVLPKNTEIPRSEELIQRCKRLKAEQKTREYEKMTKNVDSFRRKLPEDTIGYQMRQLNKQLIAVFQFIVSVITGFAFGFIGVELLVGNLDFGFRLLLGIMCALVIALAELYFLAKKLNEDLQFDYNKPSIKHCKVE